MRRESLHGSEAVEAHVESVLVIVSHEAPLFPREITCFERPHLEGLILWRVLGEPFSRSFPAREA